jgi:CheY-like chemotaxis protein
MRECPVILVAEDDEDYVILIRQVFAKAHIPNPIHVVWNGEEAISYLKGEGKYSNRDEYPLPDIFLLDLKMPRINGFEVLRWVSTGREFIFGETVRLRRLHQSQPADCGFLVQSQPHSGDIPPAAEKSENQFRRERLTLVWDSNAPKFCELSRPARFPSASESCRTHRRH